MPDGKLAIRPIAGNSGLGVIVLEVDLERKRISLSMKGDVNVDVDSSGDYAN